MSTLSASESSNTLSICLARLDAAEKNYVDANKAYRKIKNSNKRADDKLIERRGDAEETNMKKSLGIICEVARFASQPGQLLPDDLYRLVERAAAVENEVIDLSFQAEHDGSYIACGNILKEKGVGSMGSSIGVAAAKDLLRIMSNFREPTNSTKNEEFMDKLLGSAITPYKDMPKPSPYTSPLARFGIQPVTPGPNASPATIAFAEARCEIQSDEICRPAVMRLAGDTLAILGAGGWKEQAGVLSIRDLSSGNETDIDYTEKTYSLGRQGGHEIALDDTRKLVYNAGSRVINAYRYGPGKKGDEDFIVDEKEDAVADKGKSANVAGGDSGDDDSEDEYDDDDDDVILGAQDGQDKLAFSLKTNDYEGVLGLTADGAKVLRTGSKGLGVWDIPSRSAGREARFTSIESKAFANVGVWTEHPSSSRQRLIASGEHSFFVSSADVETGQVTARYVGHNHGVNTFATGKEDPHNFLTASSDGAVRFYDSRLPAPIYAIEQASGDDIQAALYEHIGGHPFIIIGGNKSQQVKIWDARARTPLYRLSTGNNAVQALAWDGSRNHLFAATDCEYLGYHGTAFGYREAEFGDEDDEEMAWPEKAWHDENSFGYPFDCGSHRLIRYSFKTEPDTKVLPEYGQAQPDEGGGGGFGGMW